MNSFGNRFRLTTFGESHGPATGGVIDGCPAGIHIDREALQRCMDRRRPGASPLASARSEEDRLEILSGLSPDSVTLGSPIVFMVANRDCRPQDYENMRDTYRPNHADRVYDIKYGVRDWRGGGRASARETLARVAAGGIACQVMERFAPSLSVRACLTDVAGVHDPEAWSHTAQGPSPLLAQTIEALRGDLTSGGGIVECIVTGLPHGVGEPVGDKLHARLGGAMLSINAAMGFEYGDGFAAASALGHEFADEMECGDDGCVRTLTNHCGGINGGISNGEDIRFRVAFKPTPTIARPLHTVHADSTPAVLEAHGRHDPCVALRAVPVVEAMAYITLLDLTLEGCIPHIPII